MPGETNDKYISKEKYYDLEKRLSVLETVVDGVVKTVEETKESVNRIETSIQQSKNTTIALMATSIVSLVGIIFTILITLKG